jgi:glycine cleavage system H protein
MWCVGRWPHRQRARRNGVGAVSGDDRDTIGGERSRGRPKRLLPAEPTAARRSREIVEIDGCPLPEDRLYDLEHDVWWADETEQGTARVGILATLAAFAGPFHTFTFRPVEGTVGRGRSVATVESFRYTGAVRLPVDAVLLERNEALARRPRLLNDAPYGEGWVVRVRAVQPEDPGRTLETAAAISARLRERIRVQRIHCWPVTPDLEMFEIGVECSAVLTKLNEELARRPANDAVLLVTDDPTSPIEMVRWSDQTGHRVLAHRTEGVLHEFLVRKEAHPVPRVRGS